MNQHQLSAVEGVKWKGFKPLSTSELKESILKKLCNQSGQSLPLFLMMLLVTTTFCFLILFFVKKSYLSQRMRLDTYLCAKSQIKQMNGYIKKMAQINSLLASATVLQIVPQLTAVMGSIIKILKLTQNGVHVVHIAKVFKNSFCNKSAVFQKPILTPYRSKGFSLSRRKDNTARLRNKKWTLYILPRIKKDTLFDAFFIEAKFSLKSRFNPSLSYRTKEQTPKDSVLSKLPFLSGSFSPLY